MCIHRYAEESVPVHVYVCMYVCVYTDTLKKVYQYTHGNVPLVCMYVCVHTWKDASGEYVCVRPSLCACMCVCIDVYVLDRVVCVCVYVCMYIYLCVYKSTYVSLMFVDELAHV